MNKWRSKLLIMFVALSVIFAISNFSYNDSMLSLDELPIANGEKEGHLKL
jgi:hypothetical protein